MPCFIRGPMNLRGGRNSQMLHNKIKMNLGGPSETVYSRHQAGYMPESGVIKSLSLGHLELLKLTISSKTAHKSSKAYSNYLGLG